MKVHIGKYKKRRQISIHIDSWDTWSADHTLSMIIHPLLKRLQKEKHGAPAVDDEDVPEELRSTAPGARDKCQNEWDTDANWFKRWDYVLDEMIWAHSEVAKDDRPDFWIVEPVYDWDNPKPAGERKSLSINTLVEGVYDHKASEEYEKKVSNGLRLFGKYYRGLWT